jgi:hypothetical protein
MYLKTVFLPAIFLLLSIYSFAQQIPVSVHAEESAYYHAYYQKQPAQTSSTYFRGSPTGLRQMVFGYHPYWMNDSWGEYQWDKLSDLCYFSYEADPATGKPLTTNDFESAAVIDTALQHQVNVHICVTLFSGHSSFFANPAAQDTLIDRLYRLVLARGIQGINIDFEAIPSTQRVQFTNFMLRLSESIKSMSPGTMISIASPAVNWNETFELEKLAPAIDFFMVMCYDYYWNGSNTAGPVSCLYPSENAYNYSVARSIRYYLTLVPANKIVMGLPYYGRTWPVQAQTVPSATRGSGSALMYKTIRNNAQGFYAWNTKHYEPNSRSTYYAYQANGWNQCFMDNCNSLEKKYDLALGYHLKGIGIWALGYDEGYPELWNLIGEKFTPDAGMNCTDTISDSGGRLFTSDEEASNVFVIKPIGGGPVNLNFLNTDLNGSAIRIYDGQDTLAPLLVNLSGTRIPEPVTSSGPALTIQLIRNNSSAFEPEYSYTWNCPSAGLSDTKLTGEISVYPNPSNGNFRVEFSNRSNETACYFLFNAAGRLMTEGKTETNGTITFSDEYTRQPGIYFLRILTSQNIMTSRVMVIR